MRAARWLPASLFGRVTLILVCGLVLSQGLSYALMRYQQVQIGKAGMLAALGHDVACGMGNVAILSNVFAGSAATPPGADVKVLAHYQNLAAWRRR